MQKIECKYHMRYEIQVNIIGSVPGVACALYQLHASVERLYCIPLHNRKALLCVYRAGAAGIYEKRSRKGVYGRATDPTGFTFARSAWALQNVTFVPTYIHTYFESAIRCLMLGRSAMMPDRVIYSVRSSAIMCC